MGFFLIFFVYGLSAEPILEKNKTIRMLLHERYEEFGNPIVVSPVAANKFQELDVAWEWMQMGGIDIAYADEEYFFLVTELENNVEKYKAFADDIEGKIAVNTYRGDLASGVDFFSRECGIEVFQKTGIHGVIYLYMNKVEPKNVVCESYVISFTLANLELSIEKGVLFLSQEKSERK